MTDKELADIICRALLAIVSALRKKYNLPNHNGITVVLQSEPPAVVYTMPHVVEHDKISV